MYRSGLKGDRLVRLWLGVGVFRCSATRGMAYPHDSVNELDDPRGSSVPFGTDAGDDRSDLNLQSYRQQRPKSALGYQWKSAEMDMV